MTKLYMTAARVRVRIINSGRFTSRVSCCDDELKVRFMNIHIRNASHTAVCRERGRHGRMTKAITDACDDTSELMPRKQ